MRYQKYVLLTLSLLTSMACAGPSDDLLLAFAEHCRNGRVQSGVPTNHRLKLISVAEMMKGDVVMLETPYLTGTGHRFMDGYFEDDVGTIKKYMFIGEAEFNEKGQIVRLLDRSGFAHGSKIASDPELFIKQLKTTAPRLVPPEGIKVESFAKTQHLDARLVSDSTDNLRHDAIEPAVSGFVFQLEAVLAPNKTVKQKQTYLGHVVPNLPILRLYSKMMEEEGHDTSTYDQVLEAIEKHQIPSDVLLRKAIAAIRQTRPGFRTPDQNAELVKATTFAKPSGK